MNIRQSFLVLEQRSIGNLSSTPQLTYALPVRNAGAIFTTAFQKAHFAVLSKLLLSHSRYKTYLKKTISLFTKLILMIIAEACGGGMLVLTRPSGVFSTKGTTYANYERCRWKIEVEKRKVRTMSPLLFQLGIIITVHP